VSGLAATVQDDATEAWIGTNILHLRPREDLYSDEALASLEDRASLYLRAGIPVHLRGPAGTGKSTLALQVATKLGRPVALLSGDGSMSPADLTGREAGTRSRQVVDRFIHNVHKRETETSAMWLDSALTEAMLHGYTLFYDEFTRSRPSTNNALLMALEERRLVVPGRKGGCYVEAHPEFRAIFTSNPSDYAGVETPQDALIDRMITLDVGGHSAETEAGIVTCNAPIDAEEALRIVNAVRAFWPEGGKHASIRASIVIAKVVASADLQVGPEDAGFVQLCIDALHSRWAEHGEGRTRQAFVRRLRAAFEKG
jgi:gas vesicle protein GvpN